MIMMNNQNFYGTTQVAGGAYIGYQALKHGLPRAVGIRIEYHTTSKENVRLIQRSGNILNPGCGGKNGFGQKVNSNRCIENSQNFVHITGLHSNSKLFNISRFKKYKNFKPMFRTIGRKSDVFMYRIVGNGDYNTVSRNFRRANSLLHKTKIILKEFININLHKKTKTFCIPGIDSYFNKEFISDNDDCLALKTSKPVKVFNNRFRAMIEGLKQFGLKGVKENKSRSLLGFAMVSTGLCAAIKLINKGKNNILK